MKPVYALFWVALAGVVVSFVGTIATAVHQHHVENIPHVVITPAAPQ